MDYSKVSAAGISNLNFFLTEIFSQYRSQEFIDICKAFKYCGDQFDVFTNFNVDRFLYAFGLCVNPKYRGCGIATEMLKARAPILRALGMKVTSTAFTGIGSQIAAAKAGYNVDLEVEYAKIQHVFPGFDFSKSPTKTFKSMSLSV